MAKRRIVRPEEEDEEKPEEDRKPAFKEPKFDETEFLQTENRSAKLIYISLATAVAAGIVTFGLMTLLHSIKVEEKFTIPIVVPVIFAFIAIYLFKRFGIDVKALEWKKWLENGFMFVLAWFAIWLLTMNPPFSDFSDPLISEPLIEVEVESGSTIHYIDDSMYIDDRPVPVDADEYNSVSEVEDIKRVTVYSMITDNWKLDSRNAVLEYEDDSGRWSKVEEGSSLNLTIERYDEKLNLTGNVSGKLDDTWLIRDDDIRADHMFRVRFSPANKSQLENIDPQEEVRFRVVFKARDSRDNQARVEVSFTL